MDLQTKIKKIYDEHLINFNDPRKLSETTQRRYDKHFKTLFNKDSGKITLPRDYAQKKKLTYRQYTHYRTALMQRFMQKILDSTDKQTIERQIQNYETVKFDKYEPEPKPEPEIDPKHFERVLRGLKNSNKQRKQPLSNTELEELAYQRITNKQEKEKSQRKTKSRSLKGLPTWWEEMVRNEMPNEYQDILKVIESTGCRPIEIHRNPIKLEYDQDQQTITAHIKGAKLSNKENYRGGRIKAGSGQAWRKITFDINSENGKKLFNICKQHKKKIVNIQLTEISIEAFKARYTRAAKKALNKPVSLYTLRHKIGCVMKTEGIDYVTIAEALGHQATSSTQKYGFIDKSRGGGSGIIKTEASTQVRNNAKHSMSHSNNNRPSL